jgi:hypothetical protein
MTNFRVSPSYWGTFKANIVGLSSTPGMQEIEANRVEKALETIDSGRSRLLCYVYAFLPLERPDVLLLPAGVWVGVPESSNPPQPEGGFVVLSALKYLAGEWTSSSTVDSP